MVGPSVTPQRYLFRVARALDRLGNAVLGGDDQETISHRAARARARGVRWGGVVCWFLDRFELGHCDKVFRDPSPTDALMPHDAPLTGDANKES